MSGRHPTPLAPAPWTSQPQGGPLGNLVSMDGVLALALPGQSLRPLGAGKDPIRLVPRLLTDATGFECCCTQSFECTCNECVQQDRYEQNDGGTCCYARPGELSGLGDRVTGGFWQGETKTWVDGVLTQHEFVRLTQIEDGEFRNDGLFFGNEVYAHVPATIQVADVVRRCTETYDEVVRFRAGLFRRVGPPNGPRVWELPQFCTGLYTAACNANKCCLTSDAGCYYYMDDMVNADPDTDPRTGDTCEGANYTAFFRTSSFNTVWESTVTSRFKVDRCQTSTCDIDCTDRCT